MSKQITSLTKEQESKIPEYLERFRAYGLSTERVDQAKAAQALHAIDAYLNQNPGRVVFVDSPHQGAIMAQLVVDYGVDKALDLYSKAELSTTGFELVKENVHQQASMASYGSFEAYWSSFYAFIEQQLPAESDGLATLVENVVANVGVYWTFIDDSTNTSFYIVSDRPTEIHMNASNQLHNEHGYALKYADGTGVCAIEGTRLPLWLFNAPKSEIDPKRILRISNVTTRMVAQKWYGMDKFLDVLPHRVLDLDPLEEGAALIEIDMPDLGPQRFMKMVNPSTGEIHVEAVSNDVKTAEEGWKNRWPQRLVDKYGFRRPEAKA